LKGSDAPTILQIWCFRQCGFGFWILKNKLAITTAIEFAMLEYKAIEPPILQNVKHSPETANKLNMAFIANEVGFLFIRRLKNK